MIRRNDKNTPGFFYGLDKSKQTQIYRLDRNLNRLGFARVAEWGRRVIGEKRCRRSDLKYLLKKSFTGSRGGGLPTGFSLSGSRQIPS